MRNLYYENCCIFNETKFTEVYDLLKLTFSLIKNHYIRFKRLENHSAMLKILSV